MRRRDREMPKEFALEIIDKCGYAVLSMIDQDAPYAVPISVARDGDTVYFLRSYPRVCLVFVGDVRPAFDKFTTEYESAIVTGNAREVLKDSEKIHALRIICERYTPSNMYQFDEAIEKSLDRTAIWKVDISTISGKRKKYGPDGEEVKYGRPLSIL